MPFLSSPPRTVPTMSCTNIPNPLRDLLATVAAHPGLPIDHLAPEQYKLAVAYGWVYVYRGRVGLTGAGRGTAWVLEATEIKTCPWRDVVTLSRSASDTVRSESPESGEQIDVVVGPERCPEGDWHRHPAL